MTTTEKSNAGTHYLEARRIGRIWRVVVRGTKRLARNAQGSPVDGGGHRCFGPADRQARAITGANIRDERVCPPCRQAGKESVATNDTKDTKGKPMWTDATCEMCPYWNDIDGCLVDGPGTSPHDIACELYDGDDAEDDEDEE